MSCSSGHCLPLALLCDGHPDCPDAADEESCLGWWSPLGLQPTRHPLPQAHLVSPKLPASSPSSIQAPTRKLAPVGA